MRAILPLRVSVVATIALLVFGLSRAAADEPTTMDPAGMETAGVDEQLERARELLATDREAGIAELRRLARSERSDVLFLLGRVLFYEVGTEEARAEGVQLLKASAKLGDLDAHLALATLHMLGDGVEYSQVLAFDLTSNAAAFGHPMAQAALAQIYLHGNRAKRSDPMLAFAHGAVAVSLGCADGHTVRVNAGRQLSVEEKEEARAIAEEMIAEFRESFPDRFASLEYHPGIVHLLPAEVKALVSRAEAGDVDAMMELAELFSSDTVVPMDYDAVADWTRRAAERGHVGALSNLGGYFLGSPYVSYDAFEAFVYLSAADVLGGEVSESDLARARERIGPSRLPEAERRVLQLIKTIHATKAQR